MKNTPSKKKFRIYYKEVYFRYKDFEAESIEQAWEMVDREPDIDTSQWQLSDHCECDFDKAFEIDDNGNPMMNGGKL